MKCLRLHVDNSLYQVSLSVGTIGAQSCSDGVDDGILKSKHRESTFWQRRYWEYCISSESDYVRHMDYIAINPVKHALVSRVQDWPYSTFHRDVTRGIYPLDWAGCTDMAELTFSCEPT